MTEQHLHEQVASYLIAQYPGVVFRSDLGGYKDRHTSVQKVRGYPDLTILEPTKGKHGLLLELKDGYSKLFRQDGIPAKSRRRSHTEQAATLWFLHYRKGYLTDFATSFEEAQKIINNYLCPYTRTWIPGHYQEFLDRMYIDLPWNLQQYLDHSMIYEYWTFRN
ncbi:MAG: hypothetical protein GF334_00705 [Candidatus Altiarchaeales archaeon]|nr:hypothetical protein [Candidatus Altiarchaeales archaeon]